MSPLSLADEQLLTTVRGAQRLLNVSNTCFYEQVLPELETFKIGKTRRITLKSIRAYVARQLAASTGKRGRGRGRPRKAPLATVAANIGQTEVGA
jgi:hypothetical protein